MFPDQRPKLEFGIVLGLKSPLRFYCTICTYMYVAYIIHQPGYLCCIESLKSAVRLVKFLNFYCFQVLCQMKMIFSSQSEVFSSQRLFDYDFITIQQQYITISANNTKRIHTFVSFLQAGIFSIWPHFSQLFFQISNVHKFGFYIT